MQRTEMITRINGDMLEQDSQIKDNSIDLLLTDPPYNISADGAKPVWIDKETGKNKTTIHNQKFSESFDENWDDVAHDDFLSQLDSWAQLWFKKLRKGGSFAIFISDRYVSYLWNAMEQAGFEPKRVWTWKKPAAVPFNRSVNPVSGCEYVLFGIKPGGKRTFNADAKLDSIVERYAAADKAASILYKAVKDSKSTDDVEAIFARARKDYEDMIAGRKQKNGIVECVIPNTITYSGGLGKNRIHPTEKPQELLRYFIELLSDENDTVLDTFAGSGSAGLAGRDLNRNVILIEKDTAMFDKMSERFVEKTDLDPNLFESP
jgi:site-specific DNA-methyltransferase (adenine-specific)